jgi:hypothetical protein
VPVDDGAVLLAVEVVGLVVETVVEVGFTVELDEGADEDGELPPLPLQLKTEGPGMV